MIDSNRKSLIYSHVETSKPARAMKASGLLLYVKAAALPEIPEQELMEELRENDVCNQVPQHSDFVGVCVYEPSGELLNSPLQRQAGLDH